MDHVVVARRFDISTKPDVPKGIRSDEENCVSYSIHHFARTVPGIHQWQTGWRCRTHPRLDKLQPATTVPAVRCDFVIDHGKECSRYRDRKWLVPWVHWLFRSTRLLRQTGSSAVSTPGQIRSEERRGGKECRSRWWS